MMIEKLNEKYVYSITNIERVKKINEIIEVLNQSPRYFKIDDEDKEIIKNEGLGALFD